ncbi:MAG: Transcriptional regulatory protein CusR [Elusimicrobia bacterium]|nr:Transcriptional regulatory protein CusR [Elusimicrobiota bacterium]
MKVLIVEDDKSIRNFVSQGLKEEGHVVTTAADGKTGFDLALSNDFELLILDLMLPKMDGLTICRLLRERGCNFPVVMLTAKDSVENRVEGLDVGADDYLVKPFAFSELLARIRAVCRRKTSEGKTQMELGGLRVDLVRHKVEYEKTQIELTSREFLLLKYFMSHPGHVLSRTMIIESVWGYDFQAGTNIIDVYVNFLRKKLKKLTGKDWIRTLRNRGYVFEEPLE